MNELVSKLLNAVPQLALGVLFIVALALLLKEYRSLRGDIKTTVEDAVSSRLGALLGNLQIEAASATRILAEISAKDQKTRELTENFEVKLAERQTALDQAWSRMRESLDILERQSDALADLSPRDVAILAEHAAPADFETMLRRVLASSDARSADLSAAGNVARKRRKFQLAQLLYARAVQCDPENRDAQLEHACLRAEMDPVARDEALGKATAIVLQSLDAGDESRMANALIYLDRYDQLQALCEEILKREPHPKSAIYAQAMRDLSVALKNLGDLPRAQECLEKALEAAPDDENIIKAFLGGMRAEKDYTKLLEFSTRLLLLDPLDDYYYILMGDSLSALGRLDPALEWYSKAIEIASDETRKQLARRKMQTIEARRLIEPLLASTTSTSPSV